MFVRSVAILILDGLVLTAQEAPRPAEEAVNFYSLDKEAALGKQMATDLQRRTTSIDSPTVREFLAQVGQDLAAQVAGLKFHVTFSPVIDDDSCPNIHEFTIHEPAALPGGYVFVSAGLFLAARDEAEFAGMLAHAMGHIALRHGTRQATRGVLINNGSIPLIFMGGWTTLCSSGLLIPAESVESLRRDELEADLLAIRAMALAGFDPEALVRYIQRVQIRPTGAVSNAFSRLPERDQRIGIMMSAVEKLPPVNYAIRPPGEFAAVQQEVRRLADPPMRSVAPPSLMRKAPE